MSEFNVEVPADAVAGETCLQVTPAEDPSFALRIIVPAQAAPGDHLRFTKGADGEWNCSLERAGTAAKAADADAARSGHTAAEVSKAAAATARSGRARVPPEAIPGKTQLEVEVGTERKTLTVTVPEKAVAGDWLLASWDAVQGHWHLRILRELSPGAWRQSLITRAVDVDALNVFERMVEAARADGAFVSPKIARGTSPPLAVPGLVTTEAVEAGEVMLRLPSRLHISPRTCQQTWPELCAAVEGVADLSEFRLVEAVHNACVATLLAAAAPLMSGEGGEKLQFCALWQHYAEALLAEPFDRHPYVLALADEAGLLSVLEPSGEGAYAELMGQDAAATHQMIEAGVPPELLCPGFTPGRFLQARLCTLTREFGTPAGSALVPILDFGNHCDARPGMRVSWDLAEDVMVVKAIRAHAAGEELYITYGRHSNPVLFRTYGFVGLPEEEPTWTYACLATDFGDLSSGALAGHLAVRFPSLAEVHLDASELTPTAVTVLDACTDARCDILDVLRTFCRRVAERYEKDAALREPIVALRRERELRPASAAWWDHMPLHRASGECAGDWKAELAATSVRVKMSEYLCLLAHIEAADFLSGDLDEERCLAGAAGLRQALAERACAGRLGGTAQTSATLADSSFSA